MREISRGVEEDTHPKEEEEAVSKSKKKKSLARREGGFAWVGKGLNLCLGMSLVMCYKSYIA